MNSCQLPVKALGTENRNWELFIHFPLTLTLSPIGGEGIKELVGSAHPTQAGGLCRFKKIWELGTTK
jgi:hypothetical protein